MEQNQVSDEELLERINKVLNESKEDRRKRVAENQQEDNLGENFHDVYETTEQERFNKNNNNNIKNNSGEGFEIGGSKNLVLENHYLSLQLKAEKKRAKELQAKFKLFENSVKYFERLNGQLENIKRTVDEGFTEESDTKIFTNEKETMQKIRPKTVHTAASGTVTNMQQSGAENYSEPPSDDQGNKLKGGQEKEEVAFRDAEDFKLLEQGLEIIKDKKNVLDSEAEKVFITKTEKRCLEDIGNLASRTRTPIDDKHQRFFEKDRRKFANSIAMPEIQEVDKAEVVPPEIISKTNETPVNITSTELDGLRSYLLQLKELIARRETAWARTTERDYSQRVEITRFKNEVGRLRMLCEKRQRDIKERDQIIANKDEEIKELQKRIQGLRNAIMKLEKKDEKLMDTIDEMTNEVLENSQIVQRSYNAMKRQSMMNRANNLSSPGAVTHVKPNGSMQVKPSSKSKDSIYAKPKTSLDKLNAKKGRPFEAATAAATTTVTTTTNEDEWKYFAKKLGQGGISSKEREKDSRRHKGEFLVNKTKETYEKVDEKLQRVEEMLHNEVLKEARKSLQPVRSGGGKMAANFKPYGKYQHQVIGKNAMEISLQSKKLTPSNSTIRQEMLTAMTGLNANSNLCMRSPGYPDPKKNQATAAVIANALLAARNANSFNY